jgi:hypothetical protein
MSTVRKSTAKRDCQWEARKYWFSRRTRERRGKEANFAAMKKRSQEKKVKKRLISGIGK